MPALGILNVSDLSTYAVEDFIPIDREVFFRLFERQNEFAWPFHLLALGGMVFVFVQVYRQQFRFIPALLAVALVVVGYSFHLRLFSELSWTANYFAAIYFFLAGLLLLTEALCWNKWPGKVDSISPLRCNFGMGLSLFGGVFYPLTVAFVRDSIAGSEFFSITPDATMLFVMGVLFMLPVIHRGLFVLPFLWCVISGIIWYGLDWYPGLVLWLLAGVSCAFGLWTMLRHRESS
ncbi:hypothetical protein TDB9533_04310 [Thalassocella blandensis]|nr:hypothetical protein TDB9533_04310 [Thalassocella blandensis]